MKVSHYILSLVTLIFTLTACVSQKKSSSTKSKSNSNDLELSYNNARQAESYFLTGMKYFVLEDYDKALMYFHKSHAIHPNAAGTNFQIAQIYLSTGNTKEALPFCEKALSLNDSNTYYYQILAQCYTQLVEEATTEKERNNYLKKSTQTYEALVKKFPSEDDVYFNLANLYLQLGDVNSGLKSIEKIEEKYGVTEEISLQKQQIYLHINQLDNAINEGEKLIAAYPNEPKYKVALAKVYFSNSKLVDAQRILENASQNNELNGEGKVLLSDIYWSNNEYDKSTEMLLSAFDDADYDVNQKINIAVGFINSNRTRIDENALHKMCESLIKLHPSEAKSYVVYGDFLLTQNKKREGRSQYLKALSLEEGFFQVWQNVIILDSDLDEVDSILIHTERALEIYPNQGVFWYYNANAHLIKKDFKKAVYALEKAEFLISDDNTLYLIINAQLGDAYNSLKEYQKSDNAYEKVLAIDANNAHVLNNYSYFLSLRNEKLDLASKMCLKLMELEPNNSTYLDTYAWVLYKQKEYSKAKKLLEKALLTSNDGTIIEHYGDVLFQLNDVENAIIQWEKAKETGDYSDLLDKKIKDKKLYE